MNGGTEMDVDKFISNMRADAGTYTQIHKKSDDEFDKWFDEENALLSFRKIVGTVVHAVSS